MHTQYAPCMYLRVVMGYEQGDILIKRLKADATICRQRVMGRHCCQIGKTLHNGIHETTALGAYLSRLAKYKVQPRSSRCLASQQAAPTP